MVGILAALSKGNDPKNEIEKVLPYFDCEGSSLQSLEQDRLSIYHRSTGEIDCGGVHKNDNLAVGIYGRITLRQRNTPVTAEDLFSLYQKCGTKLFDRVEGSFSVIIWDSNKQELILARDRTGVKQLFYTDIGDSVLVSSEIYPILQHPEFVTEPNIPMVSEYLCRRITSTTNSFYKDLHKVSYAGITTINGSVNNQRYWEPGRGNVNHHCIVDVLSNSLKQITLNEDKVGVSMSGGLDSTSIVCLANQNAINVEAYSLTSTNNDFKGELERIRSMESENIDITEISMDSHWPLTDKFFRNTQLNTPCVDITPTASTELIRSATEEVDVLLSGVGGNMLDGNRFSYIDMIRRRKFPQAVKSFSRDKLTFSIFILDYVIPFMRNELRPGKSKLGVTDLPIRKSLLSDDCVAAIEKADKIENPSYRTELQFMYESFFLSERDFRMDLTQTRASRHGIEIRYPYLDAQLFDLVFSSDPGELFQRGRTKHTFLKEVESILPDQVLDQSDSANFNSIIDKAIRDERRKMEDLFEDSKLVKHNIVRSDAIEELRNNISRIPKHDLWTILSAELWLREL